MEIKLKIRPERDSYNSYPEVVEFYVTGDSLKIIVGDRELTFNQEDIVKIVKTFDI